MRREKHTYEQSENGQEALEAFKACNGPKSSKHDDDSRQPLDLVLMNIEMPVMNGLQCTKAIREHERKHDLRPTYIVACTAWGDWQTQREAKKAGVDAFLPKPLKFAHLKELIAGLMERERFSDGLHSIIPVYTRDMAVEFAVCVENAARA